MAREKLEAETAKRVKQAIAMYRANHQQRAHDERSHYGNHKNRTFEQAVWDAARSLKPNGKQHQHQWAISAATLIAFANELVKYAPQLRRARDFASLHSIIEQLDFYGIGELATYDVATRIGQYRGIYPEAVYLHRGTADGAAILGLRGAGGTISLANLPAEFRGLTAEDIEDILCIFKGYFGGGPLNISGCGCGQRGGC